MTTARGRFVANTIRVVLTVSGVLAVAAVLIALRGPSTWDSVVEASLAVLFLVVPAVGAVALRANPHNRVGWALLSTGFGFALKSFALVYGDVALNNGRGLPAAIYVAWLDPVGGNFYGFGLVFTLLLLPDGRLPGRRWRWAARCAIGCLVPRLGSLVAADFWHFDARNPLGLPGLAGQAADISMLVAVVILPVVYTLAALVMTAPAARRPSRRSA